MGMAQFTLLCFDLNFPEQSCMKYLIRSVEIHSISGLFGHQKLEHQHCTCADENNFVSSAIGQELERRLSVLDGLVSLNFH